MITDRINQIIILIEVSSKRCHETSRILDNKSKNVFRLRCAHKTKRSIKEIAVTWNCQQIYDHSIVFIEIHKKWFASKLTSSPRRSSVICDMYFFKKKFQLLVTFRKTITDFDRFSIKMFNNDNHRSFIHKSSLSSQLRYLRNFDHSKFIENSTSWRTIELWRERVLKNHSSRNWF